MDIRLVRDQQDILLLLDGMLEETLERHLVEEEEVSPLTREEDGTVILLLHTASIPRQDQDSLDPSREAWQRHLVQEPWEVQWEDTWDPDMVEVDLEALEDLP